MLSCQGLDAEKKNQIHQRYELHQQLEEQSMQICAHILYFDHFLYNEVSSQPRVLIVLILFLLY